MPAGDLVVAVVLKSGHPPNWNPESPSITPFARIRTGCWQGCCSRYSGRRGTQNRARALRVKRVAGIFDEIMRLHPKKRSCQSRMRDIGVIQQGEYPESPDNRSRNNAESPNVEPASVSALVSPVVSKMNQRNSILDGMSVSGRLKGVPKAVFAARLR